MGSVKRSNDFLQRRATGTQYLLDALTASWSQVQRDDPLVCTLTAFEQSGLAEFVDKPDTPGVRQHQRAAEKIHAAAGIVPDDHESGGSLPGHWQFGGDLLHQAIVRGNDESTEQVAASWVCHGGPPFFRANVTAAAGGLNIVKTFYMYAAYIAKGKLGMPLRFLPCVPMRAGLAGARTLLVLALWIPHVSPQAATGVTITTDYDFRGETQTDYGPALQVTWDRVLPSGPHLSLFTNNVHFATPQGARGPGLEFNPSAEWLHDLPSGVTIGAGGTYYFYRDHGASRLDYGEFTVSAANRYLKALLAYAPAYDGNTNPTHYAAWYAGSDVTIPVSEQVALGSHLGYAWGPYWSLVQHEKKVDGSAGLTWSFGRYALRFQVVARRYTHDTAPSAPIRAIVSIDSSFLP